MRLPDPKDEAEVLIRTRAERRAAEDEQMQRIPEWRKRLTNRDQTGQVKA